MWPKEQWPALKFKEGIKDGAKGSHGPIRYTVEKYNPSEIIQFRFSNPKGFNGICELKIKELTNTTCEINHTIDMKTIGNATLVWALSIRPLHNALIEGAFDKLENNFSKITKSSKCNIWVRIPRRQIAKRER